MIFSTFFYQKTPPGPHMNRQKRFRKKFFVFVKKFAKSCEKHVRVVNDNNFYILIFSNYFNEFSDPYICNFCTFNKRYTLVFSVQCYQNLVDKI